jgi:C4-dicarboxylate transporter DctM subunit
MTIETIGILVIIATLILMFLGIPITISMAVPAFIGIMYLRDFEAMFAVIESTAWQQMFSYGLSCVPLFMLMGDLLFVSQISTDLFATFNRWFGRLKGGLALATIGSCAAFSAACGSSLATTATMAVIASPEMDKAGYDKRLSGGAIVAGGTLGILIPPSSMMILYGMITEESIGKLLIAGVIPGILLTVLYMLTIYIWTRVNPNLCDVSAESFTWKERISALNNVTPIAIIFLVVIGGIYLGFFSATEAAAIGAAGAIVIALIKKRMNFSNFILASSRSLRTTGFLFAIIVSAFILNFLLVITKVPFLLANFFSTVGLPKLVIFILIIIMYVILGALMDAFAMIVVTLPIIIPTVKMLGFDLIWFGVVVVLIAEMAFLTPPVGINCFVLKGAVKTYNLTDIFRGALRFLVPILVLIAILYIYPNIALVLPNTMG